MKRVAAVLAALLLCLGAPPIAGAQFGPNAPAPLLQEDPEAVPFEEDEGLSTLQLVLIFGGAAIVVGLIAWLIVRDARGKAQAKRSQAQRSPSGSGSRATAQAETSPKTSAAKAARERERQKARKRNKAKAARNQRKHNRPR